ncbi:hypothetical protein CC1G_01547 [Coprinopsis cinerea okayama7|uniref:Ubinuclein middle domain-containing protein n=1 Tax=Coprinopsis cinerea (strain Okayama-7 / 130 / ATCC MYA-4618 / FGSC 9003) TaxID=240176 RepID=A8NI00_COPC7|nr:hypothetical protein CC1G_01547 [Coprinopsis cinerea okayama7\|eukprot:XP_001833870.1 hypothetical protein CC1G_01547 [Coprinopsis cinerea okayama7\
MGVSSGTEHPEPEGIPVELDDDDDDDEEDEEGEEGYEGEGVEGEGQYAEEAEEAEDDEEDDDDEEDSEDDDEDDEDEDDTDVPTATPTASTAGPQPNNRDSATPSATASNSIPQSRSAISISDLTENGVQGPLPPNQPTPGSSGISIPVLLHPNASDGASGSGVPVPVADASTSANPPNSSTSTLTTPPTSLPAPAPTTNGKPDTTSQPSASAPPSKKGKSRKRTPSPSPPPPPPPQPLQTIRLEIKLGGPSNYEVDIAQMAKDTGQRPATPPLPMALRPESEEEEPPPEETGKKRKRKKKNAGQEYYDTTDPFIDDSELAVDQRTYFAQTKQQGFYVSSGEVALLKDKSPKKPKSKKPTLSSVLHSSVSQAVSAGVLHKEASADGSHSPSGAHFGGSQGIKGVGIVNGQNQGGDKGKKPADTGAAAGWVTGADEGEGDEKTGQKRKRYITVVDNGKKRKIVNINSFHPDLQVAIEELKKAIAKESWEQKGKFPQALKPALSSLALLAIRLDEYDDHFFNLMPVLFPYNKFTMTKLIKRTVYNDHVALLQERQDELLKQLEELAKAGFAQAEAEWEKSVAAWDKRQEKIRLEAANAGGTASGDGGSGTNSAAPTRHPTEEKDGMDVDHPGSVSAPPGGAATAAGGHAPHPPGKKYRLTEQMKAIIWDLVLLSNECCRLENEKNQYEGSVIQVSEQGLRKVLYQKIVAAFPEGWMSSGQISRDVSAMKKRLEKEQLEND